VKDAAAEGVPEVVGDIIEAADVALEQEGMKPDQIKRKAEGVMDTAKNTAFQDPDKKF